MGKKSGPPAPPPPPDYTRQREAAVAAENADRASLASDYNDRIKLFNSALTDSASGIGGFRDSVSGLELGDDLSGLGDIEKEIETLRGNLESFNAGDVSWMDVNTQPTKGDPQNGARGGGITGAGLNTPRPPSPDSAAGQLAAPFNFGNSNFIIGGGVSGLPRINLGQMAAPPPPPTLQYDEFGLPIAPDFNPAGESYGASVMYDVPTLAELNTGLADKYLSDLSRIQSSIDDLQAREAAEQRRGKDFFTQYINEANQGDIDIEYADLNTDFSRFNADVAQARNEINAFDSPLSFEQKATALAELDNLEELINSRIADQTNEQTRIDQFLTGIPDDPSTPNVDESTGGVRGQIGDLQTTFDDLGIADVEDPTELRNKIRELENQLTGFDSELDYNISSDLQDLYALEDSLYGLQRERQAEENRLADLGAAARSRADAIARAASRSGSTDLYAIQDLEDQIAALESDMGNVRTDLSFDSSGQQATLDEAKDVLAGLIGERDAALLAESGELEELMAGLDGIADYDEAGLMNLRGNIQRELDQLSRYQGGTGANYDAIQAAFGSVDDRLEQLGLKRSGLESNALELLQDVRNREFFDQAGLDVAGDEIEALRQEIERYGASQANDELASLADIYRDQGSRLAADAAEVASREARDAAEVEASLDAYGNLQFPEVGDAQTMMTEEQLRAYLASIDDEDEIFNTNDQSSFARNLMSGVG